MAAILGRPSGPEVVRYQDPATELEVVRLTDPAFSSGLTAPHLRQFMRRGDSLLYWSERFGDRQVCQMDLRNGESHQLTEAKALDSAAFCLTPDDRAILYFDGPTLFESALTAARVRKLHQTPEDASRTLMTLAPDGSVLFAENKANRSRVVRVTRAAAATSFEAAGEVDLLLVRPRASQILYRDSGALWLAYLDGSARRRVNLLPGQTGEIAWTPSGRTIVYLHIPDDAKDLITLREYTPSDNTDRLVAKTSQFQSMDANTDGSVFVGASRSRASSYVLILLRVTRRELTLCEHHASDPKMVSPIFSPDSQSIFFSSDRHGKQALYRVHVEKFVEETTEG